MAEKGEGGFNTKSTSMKVEKDGKFMIVMRFWKENASGKGRVIVGDNNIFG